MELILGIISLLLIALSWFARPWLERKGYISHERETLHLEHKKAPTDLLRYVRPGTSVANMKEHLGAPFSMDTHSTNEHASAVTYRYKFSNLNLEAYSRDGITIHVMTLVLPRVEGADHFYVPMLEHVNSFMFGRDCLGTVTGKTDEVRSETSSKHGVLISEKFYGNPGQYRKYRFGVFSGPSAPYDAANSTIISSEASQDELIVNFFSLTSENGKFYRRLHYNFYAFR